MFPGTRESANMPALYRSLTCTRALCRKPVVTLRPTPIHGECAHSSWLPAHVQVGTILLSALFVYDCFWVFASERLFGSNVMMEAATKQAENPAFLAAAALRLPSAHIAPHLELPVKLLFPAKLFAAAPQEPALMLGLGDMALPGMLLALLLCHDAHRWAQPRGVAPKRALLRTLLSWRFWRQAYALPSGAGYAAGMFAALGVGTVFQAAQPALLYLVPSMLLPLLVHAAARGEVRVLWDGPPEMLHDEKRFEV